MTAREICAASGLSLSQWKQAKDAGIDVKDLEAMKAFRQTINPRTRPPLETKSDDTGSDGEKMTMAELEAALGMKGISPNEALTLQRQINAMKQLAQYRQAIGQLISRAEVEEHFVRAAMGIQAFLRRYEREVPALCLGLPLSQSVPIVKAKTRELQDMLANLQGEFWKEHPDNE